MYRFSVRTTAPQEKSTDYTETYKALLYVALLIHLAFVVTGIVYDQYISTVGDNVLCVPLFINSRDCGLAAASGRTHVFKWCIFWAHTFWHTASVIEHLVCLYLIHVTKSIDQAYNECRHVRFFSYTFTAPAMLASIYVNAFLYTSLDVVVAVVSLQATVIIIGYFSDEYQEEMCKKQCNGKQIKALKKKHDKLYYSAWVLLFFAWWPVLYETYALTRDRFTSKDTFPFFHVEKAWPVIVFSLVSVEVLLFASFGLVQRKKKLEYVESCKYDGETANYEKHVKEQGLKYETYMTIVSIVSKVMLSVLIAWAVVNRESSMSSSVINYYVGFYNTSSSKCTIVPTPAVQNLIGTNRVIKSHRGQYLEDRQGTVGLHNDKAAWQQWNISRAGHMKFYITSHRGQHLEDRAGTVGIHSDANDGRTHWTITDAGDSKFFITSHRLQQLEDRQGVLGVHNDKDAWQKWSITEA